MLLLLVWAILVVPVACLPLKLNLEDGFYSVEDGFYSVEDGFYSVGVMQEFLGGNHEYRSQNKEKLLQALMKGSKDAKEWEDPSMHVYRTKSDHFVQHIRCFNKGKIPTKDYNRDRKNLANNWRKKYLRMLRMLMMLELNGLFAAALGLMYYDLLNKDLPQFVSFTRNFWNRVWNSLFNSVSVFWLPQMVRNFGVSWKTGKRDKYFVFGNAIYGMVVVFACLNVGFDIERWAMFSDSSMVIRLLLLVTIYKHVWEIVKVSLICGSGFPSCQIPPDSTRRKTQITGYNGNCHGILRSFARMHCRGGNMDDSFEVGGAVALHQNPVSSHSNLFNVEDSKQNKEVKMFDPQNLLKLANDIESNPGPSYMCTIQEFLDGNHEYRSQNKEKLLQAVSKLDKDAKDGKIQACMYTEQNLITLYNIFDVSIRERYPQKIMTEILNLANHWNKEVRQEELRLRSERKERSELVIAINPDETTESNKERENAHNNTEQHVLQGQMTGQRKPKDGTRKGKQYKMKTSSVKKNRLHRGDWNPYGPKKNPELPVHGEPPS